MDYKHYKEMYLVRTQMCRAYKTPRDSYDALLIQRRDFKLDLLDCIDIAINKSTSVGDCELKISETLDCKLKEYTELFFIEDKDGVSSNIADYVFVSLMDEAPCDELEPFIKNIYDGFTKLIDIMHDDGCLDSASCSFTFDNGLSVIKN